MQTAALIAIVGLLIGLAQASILTMPLEQVKPGMKGKGKTVFLGGDVEEFDAEILGVIKNNQPKRSIILARLSGRGLENTGIIQGMSGSPIYVDGKLIGAVAYSFPFAKEPIAGITPIAEMLAISEQPVQARSSAASVLPLRESLSLADLMGIHNDLANARPFLLSQGQTMAPIGVPLVFGGFSPAVIEETRPLFTRSGFNPMNAGSAAQIAFAAPPAGANLKEGDPVAVELVGGDLSAAAFGTVTYVDGERVLAFGHPLYNLGKVDLAMAKANVLTVIPSLQNSFKLAALGDRLGRFSQDRTAGLLGELGKMPQTVPLEIRLLELSGRAREFKVDLANDRLLTPLLVNMTVASLLSSEQRSLGDLSFALDGHVYLDNGASVHLEDLFSGNLDTATTGLSGLLTAVVYYLSNNEFETIGIHRISLTIRAMEEAKFCTLERVWLDKYEVSAGERIQVKIHCRAFAGQSFSEEVTVEAPPLPAGSEFQLLIADAASVQQVEALQYRVQDFVPRSLSQLVRILNNLRKHNRVYFKMMASRPGLFVKGEEMPNLPPSMKSLFASPRAGASAPTELTRSTLRE
ncbi:MAG: SpoIVB peptidase S55 domain-containing protein, partial [Candidatus Aminicenantales bacterium]